MSFINVLSDEAEVKATINTLVSTMNVLTYTANEYADLSFACASRILDAAQNGSFVGKSYTDFGNYTKYRKRAQESLHVLVGIAAIIEKARDTGNDDANELYSQHLADEINVDKVIGKLEAGYMRFFQAKAAIPDSTEPGARFKVEAFNPQS